VARYTQMDSARLRRDLGLARARRITFLVAVGATAFTTVLALVAATTAPGRSTAAPSQSNPSGGGNAGAVQPGLIGPGQLPGAGNGGSPVVVTGGS
jgi:hypothetical protein